ncbi:hypothetical protein [Kitasatospora sp. McL0602]|uniref:hypothetical protein n=1 Tax=Kitasatospora sp. McL0602 TaxID=3439530 RepID=UPI003F885FEE
MEGRAVVLSSARQVIDLDHLNHHDSWVLFGVAGVVSLALILYVVNFRGVAYKIQVNEMGPEHRAYRAAVAFTRVGFAFFAVIGIGCTVQGLLGILR